MNHRRDTTSYCPVTPILLGLSLLSVIAYVYFLNTSVVHVVVQKSAMSNIQDLKNEIALLEADYISAQHTIAQRMASVEGLEAERTKIFVARDRSGEFVFNQ